ncbi:hypothetical protein [Sandaracinus amylolyticus]|uniref:hypothetical protein n=1 Tax=Sandaracinus amylolyticus TaxID=927083 RepID=UPI001F1BB7A9|nr:hypothetical protein [Sandaracinus amylolyticus]UJR80067.1 Hypothetical protein I5071_21110 [Sandaracinus amylolyticus]
MQPHLLEMLADPETRKPLSRASEADLAKLRGAIDAGRARRRDGHAIPAFEGAFLTTDRKVAYLVENGVPNFVIDERVELDAPV